MAEAKTIEERLGALVAECVDEGMSESQLRDVARPLVVVHARARRRARLRRFLRWLLILAALIGILLFDPTYRLVCIVGRLGTKHLLVPYWDFTVHYNNDCIIRNPYFVEDDEGGENLINCELLTDVCEVGVNRTSNIDGKSVANHYLKSSRPLIVTDAMEGWKTKGLDVKGLAEIFQSTSVLDESVPCSLQSTDSKVKEIRHVFEMSQGERVLTSWQNCELKAVKAIRRLYKRPYFLPGMAEMTSTNWIVVGTGGSNENYHRVVPLFDGLAAWIAVLSGTLDIKVVTQDICSAFCKTGSLDLTVTAGEILIFPTSTWWVMIYHKQQENEEDAIALASTVSWEKH
ncbi:uncharacterized protein [Oscarella lobularis]|uniref:uncharacterized protein n=1 Tax=Oscarella lobularis TaxID=121494 RepID=UPI0033132233